MLDDFHVAGLRIAFALLLLLVGSDILDRLAKRAVKQKIGRNLDDVSNFDRFVRCIGGRRNINVWILIAALALGDAANGPDLSDLFVDGAILETHR